MITKPYAICIRNDKKIVYVLYKIPAKRSINPNSKRTADELIIVGMPYKAFVKFVKKIKEVKE